MMFLAAGLIAAEPTRAATYDVDSTTDEVDLTPGDGLCATAGGECTLRAAVQEANAGPGADIINVPPGTYGLVVPRAGGDEAREGDLDIWDNLSIVGAGAHRTIIAGEWLCSIPGFCDRTRIFDIMADVEVDMLGLTIKDGFYVERGAGIYVRSGSLSLTECVLTSNRSCWYGDACYVEPGANLRLERTSVRDHSTGCSDAVGEFIMGAAVYIDGGSVDILDSDLSDNENKGLHVEGGGTATLTNCTVSGNIIEGSSAEHGGAGIFVDTGSHVEVLNSTISGNAETVVWFGELEPGAGGGLRVNPGGTARLSNCTVARNSARMEGGGILALGTVSLSNTIVADNWSDRLSGGHDCFGTLESDGFNLIEDTSFCTIEGDLTGNLTALDPRLQHLQDNGGPTLTHALPQGSPAIDAGNPETPGTGGNACEATDQRGEPRPDGPSCDMGAYETACVDDPIPPDQENVLRLVKQADDVFLDFEAAPATIWRVFRDDEKTAIGSSALPPDTRSPEFRDAAAVPAPSDYYYYYLRGLSPCTKTPGP